jgi:hypothetical protein
MSATTASFPRARGIGHSLLADAGRILKSLFAESPEKPPAAQAALAAPSDSVGLWMLYRLASGADSVSPLVAAHLARQRND